MDGWLKQSTAVTLKIGPFVDSTDGNTAETALTISQADVRLSKNGADIAQKTEATSCTHDELGMYDCPVDATDTGTLGRLDLVVAETGALVVRHTYMVVPANVWDSLFGADALQVDVAQWLGTAAATPTVAGVPEVDLTHVAGATTNVAALATNVDAILTDTADMQPKLGTPSGVSISADIAAIEAQTDDIGAAGAGLTALPPVVVATGGIGSGAIAAAEKNSLADAFLDRNMATGTDSGTDSTVFRTVRQALRTLRNKDAIVAGTRTVYKEDDTTASWTAAVATTAGDPISSVDPT